MKSLLASWIKDLMKCRHDWDDSILNPFGVAIEERCIKCGKYRHHLAEDLDGVEMGDEPKWRDGRIS